MTTKEVAIKWSAAPDMTPQTVLYRRPVAQLIATSLIRNCR